MITGMVLEFFVRSLRMPAGSSSATARRLDSSCTMLTCVSVAPRFVA